MISKRTLMIAVAATAAGLAGCATTPAPTTITDTVARTPELSTLSKLIADAGLADTLRGTGPFTVFAPTNDAFKAVPAKTLEELAKDKDRLRAVLTYHVLPVKVMAADVKTGNVKTVNGADVGVSKAGGYVTFDEALVTQADVPATNGVVHVIDKVIMPPAPRR
ncbi:MAG: fasciclin domain-containing protein [Burkholderiaceae bacterium]|nr:fasciclin domain-containing protein [Burkholderiaceae bacterium]